MAQGLSYEAAKKHVVQGMFLLGGVTFVEVMFSLLGKGHLIPGLHHITVVQYAIGVLLIALSLYKAYYIIYQFMHMAYEVKGLALSVLLPTLLLVWAIIAFFQEGNSWKSRRDQIKEKDEAPAEQSDNLQGMLNDEETYVPVGTGVR